MKSVRALFVVAGLYDGVLGAAFLARPFAIFDWYGVEPPNHVGYVQFPAALLILFALLFFRIALDPVRHRGLIPFGCGLKIAYSGVVFWHQFTEGVPSMWLPWAWADLVFLALFVWAWVRAGK